MSSKYPYLLFLEKQTVVKIGCKAACFLALLQEKAQQCEQENTLNGHFALTIDEVLAEIGLTGREQVSCIEILKKHNLIQSCLLGGLPAKRHFKLTK